MDILAVEACSTLPNLLDKRSRFAPSTQALLAHCPVAWLIAPATADSPRPRWQLTGVIRSEPRAPVILPVRDVRVLYGLRSAHYEGFAREHVPQSHEYFAPLETLARPDSARNPALQALMARACAAGSFMAAE